MEKLVDYSSHSDSELEEEAGEQLSHARNENPDEGKNSVSSPLKLEDCKRKHSSADVLDIPPAKKLREDGVQAASTCNPTVPFTLPSAILSMFSEDSEGGVGGDHQGRVRSFPHVRGNWATQVYLSVDFTTQVLASIDSFRTLLQRHYSAYEFHAQQELHVSLSRTVPIPFHWIDPLVELLRSKFNQRQSFIVGFRDIAFYVNDESTRSFVSLDVIKGQDKVGLKTVDHCDASASTEVLQMSSLTQDVDECFAAYNLPGYYKDPTFHVSLYWCLGDITKEVTNADKAILQEHWNALLGRQVTEALELSIAEVRCKTGNKVYSFHLSTHSSV